MVMEASAPSAVKRFGGRWLNGKDAAKPSEKKVVRTVPTMHQRRESMAASGNPSESRSRRVAFVSASANDKSVKMRFSQRFGSARQINSPSATSKKVTSPSNATM